MLALWRERVVCWCDRVFVPNLALAVVDHQLTTALVVDDLTGGVDGRILGWVVRTGSLGARRLDVPPSVWVRHNVPVVVSHWSGPRNALMGSRNACSARIPGAKPHNTQSEVSNGQCRASTERRNLTLEWFDLLGSCKTTTNTSIRGRKMDGPAFDVEEAGSTMAT